MYDQMETSSMHDKYVKQIFLGCGRDNCRKFFCKNKKDQSILTNVAKKLSKYSDSFICGHENELLSYINTVKKTKQDKRNHCSYKKIKIDFKDIHDLDSSTILEFFFEIVSLSNSKSDLDTFSHKYCKLIKHIQNEEEIYILENIFRLLIYMYSLEMNDTLGLIIIRVFCNFRNHYFLDTIDLGILCKIIIEVHHKRSQGLYEPFDTYNFEKECIKHPVFSVKDYVHIVESFTKLLDDYKAPFIRSDSVFEELLNTYTILYLLNEKLEVFPFKKFYLVEMCKKQNFKEEFRFFKAECKSILQYNFVLPLEIKAEFLKYENGDMMKNSLQDAFFRSLFEGPTSPYLFLTVGRSSIYKDTFEILKNIDALELKKQLKITFTNEEGVDSGGIRKEFFQLISEELQENENLFVTKNNTLWIKNNEKQLSAFELVGKLIGIALYNDVILNIPFPSVFFKKILEKQINLSDLSEIEPEIYNSLINFQNLPKEDLKATEMTFSIYFEDHSVDLVHNGDKKFIDESNLDYFIELYKDYITTKTIYKPFEAIKRGFYTIINKDLISFLQPKELEKIIVGTPCIDVQMLKKTCVLNGYDHRDIYIAQFWDIVENYSSEEKKKFLQFITGNDRIPVGGLDTLKLVIMRNGCDTNRLPSSQTCFNTLLLPYYKNKEKMKEKMDKAITMTKGFYLL